TIEPCLCLLQRTQRVPAVGEELPPVPAEEPQSGVVDVEHLEGGGVVDPHSPGVAPEGHHRRRLGPRGASRTHLREHRSATCAPCTGTFRRFDPVAAYQWPRQWVVGVAAAWATLASTCRPRSRPFCFLQPSR